MSGLATNLALVLATLVIGLFCAGYAAAQIVPPQVLLAEVLP
ncbi:hypothetical protein ACO2Q0_17355 [Phenylobacterium sp. VNQ135]